MSNGTILLVDHNPFSASEIFIALEDMGYSVIGPVGSESEALKAWKDGPPLAAIVNGETISIMPELTGVLKKTDIPTAILSDQNKLLPSAFTIKVNDISGSLLAFLIDPGIASNADRSNENFDSAIMTPAGFLEELTTHTAI